jgi:hypothetical protein
METPIHDIWTNHIYKQNERKYIVQGKRQKENDIYLRYFGWKCFLKIFVGHLGVPLREN